MCAPFHAADSAPEHTIRLHFDDRLPVPPETAQHRGAVWRWQSGAERHLLEQYGTPDKPPRFTYAVTHGAHTEVTFANAYRAGASVRAVLEAAGLFDIFAARGMLVLHSAYIVASAGKAILFSGPSGVGKSTPCALERCAGARVVNGDRALVDVGKKTANGHFLFRHVRHIRKCHGAGPGDRPARAGERKPRACPEPAGSVCGCAQPVRVLRMGRVLCGKNDRMRGASLSPMCRCCAWTACRTPRRSMPCGANWEVSDMEQMSTEPRLSAYLHARACAKGIPACGKL